MIYPINIRCTSHSALDKYLPYIGRTYPVGDEFLDDAVCRIVEEAAEIVKRLKDRPDKVVFEVSSRIAKNKIQYFEGTVEYQKKNFHKRVSPSTQIFLSKDSTYQLLVQRVKPSREEEIFLSFLKEAFPECKFKLENFSLQCNINGEWVRLKWEKTSETTMVDEDPFHGTKNEQAGEEYTMLKWLVSEVGRLLTNKGTHVEIKRLIQFSDFLKMRGED